ncbi:MAG: OmpH family outer membrane protein [Desulfobacteraceae bacterium]|nr:MAG: OmpH family outer membrane protein [Desulfobacteraceae bacterium]
MKRTSRLFLAILLFTVFTAAGAMAEVKIGVFDLEKFQQKSQVIKKKREAMEKRFAPAKAKVEQENEALKKLEAEFQKKRSVLKVDAINDMLLDIDAKRRLVKFLAEDFNITVKAAEIETAKTAEKDLSEIIKVLAKNLGLTVIFEKNVPGLLWSDGAVDITDKVIEQYDKTIKP